MAARAGADHDDIMVLEKIDTYGKSSADMRAVQALVYATLNRAQSVLSDCSSGARLISVIEHS